jgi:hypothetical protein
MENRVSVMELHNTYTFSRAHPFHNMVRAYVENYYIISKFRKICERK